MGDKFEVELANGNKKEATLITRVKPEGKDIEYIYYFIEDEEDSNNVAIYASKVVKEMRYIGWDVCFSNKGPILVEGNEYPGHDIYQLPEHTHDHYGIWPKFTKAFKK